MMGLPIDATLGERIRFYRQQAGQSDNEIFDGDTPVPTEKPQSPERNRERKIKTAG